MPMRWPISAKAMKALRLGLIRKWWSVGRVGWDGGGGDDGGRVSLSRSCWSWGEGDEVAAGANGDLPGISSGSVAGGEEVDVDAA